MLRSASLAVALMFTAPAVALAKKPLDFNKLTEAGHTIVQGHVNHDQRLGYKVSGNVLVNQLPLFQILGASESLDEGRVVRETYDIQDPALEISNELTKFVGEKLGLPVALGTLPQVDKERGTFAQAIPMQNQEDLSAHYGPGKLIINAGTAKWGVSQRSGDRYFLFYLANVEVVDTTTSKVIWKDGCFFPLRGKSELPMSATILDNNAASLKQEIAKAKDYCVAQFIAEIQGGA